MNDDESAHMPRDFPAELTVIGVKTLASLIPFVGGSAAEVLGAILQPQIDQRKTVWLEGIAKGLNELRKLVADLTPERLAQNEAFTTTFLHASQVAMRTHQYEKLTALRNAVLNVAAGTAPDESMQLMFLDALDTLTPWHLLLLDCIADPIGWSARRQYPLAKGHTPNPAVIFEAFFRDTMPVKGFDSQLLEDLYNRGLAANNVNPRGQLIFHDEADTIPHITEMGASFLGFISSPNTDV